MYLHAIGWQIGKKDKIDLEGPKLKEKEGLYTCPPTSPGQKSFHCCLKVREELIKVQPPTALAGCLLAACPLPRYEHLHQDKSRPVHAVLVLSLVEKHTLIDP